jgi:glyoxylase-like metal-dependent hydrolase (beta-lactamase superfamily II)/rhodanese-related sulfurtransferase
MIIRQFFIPGIAHSSYLIGGIGSCLIIDPSRDIGQYLTAAKEEGMQIVGILETHLHADFVSGHCDLADVTGAPIYMPESAGCLFPHIPVRNKSLITVEDLKIEVRETPGHTPEHISYVLFHLSRGDKPVAVFCGDTLFVGDVGRPDLFPGKAQELGAALYSSLHNQLLTLPDYCEVYPAHGAGSLCGRLISAKRSSTIGYEREFNQALAFSSQDEFIRHLTTDMPPAPDHFSRCSEINRAGPALMKNFPPPAPLNPKKVSEILSKGFNDVIDIRRYDAFGGMHIPGSINVDAEVNFSTFAGWVINSEKSHVLVTHNRDQADNIAIMLRRVGIDTISGFLAGGLQAWALTGFGTDHCKICSPSDVEKRRVNHPDMVILDVRTRSEYEGYHIQGSINIHWPDLRTRYTELDRSCPTAIICGTGVRAGIAGSILKREGFEDICIIAGGYSGWIATGLK